MTVKLFIEIPKGSHNKYEVDEETGELKLDRVLYGTAQFPFEYGFIKGTKGEDGDPLDALMLSTFPTFPGCAVEAEVIGYLEMEDEGGVDHKVVTVPKAKLDPRWAHIKDVTDLPEALRNEIKDFFETYKRLEPNKWVKVSAFKPKEEAEKLVESATQKNAA
ncbi:MAG: inorganic diphosphatase [Candidatus Wildermuthbacteria bacterium]|nr:inorganic diphosphatase [Candidatus Wildermuthbacteria bacterium]